MYVPVESPNIVEPDPEPVVVIPPGALVNVQVPVAGKPLKAMLPVAEAQVGCVIVPIAGEFGVAGWAFITTLPDAIEVHNEAFVTV